MSIAARLPMPTASVTKRAVLATSPPAHTLSAPVAWLRRSATNRPRCDGIAAAKSPRSASAPIEVRMALAARVNSAPSTGATVNCPRSAPGTTRTFWQVITMPWAVAGFTSLSMAPSTSVMPSSSASPTSSGCAGS